MEQLQPQDELASIKIIGIITIAALVLIQFFIWWWRSKNNDVPFEKPIVQGDKFLEDYNDFHSHEN